MIQQTAAMSMMTLIVMVGCASAPGTRPQDMNAAQHERAAAEHETMEGGHEAQFRPASRDTTDETNCATYLGECWSSNPTEKHRNEAREHRAIAAQHRAASESLRQAEATACVGVPAMDRDASPFVHREAIVRVEPLIRREAVSYTGGAIEKQVGATVVLLPAAGLTAERLQRVVTCHAARAASLGHNSELSFCPLAVKGATPTVRSTGDGFAIDVSADGREEAAEILARAQRLSAR
jgi:hypothetical protein